MRFFRNVGVSDAGDSVVGVMEGAVGLMPAARLDDGAEVSTRACDGSKEPEEVRMKR